MRKILYISILVILFASCNTEPQFREQIVIEGWIEDGEPPIVLLHKTVGFEEEIVSIEDIVIEKTISLGYVSIGDGEQNVVLIGKLDTLYLPPYKYTTGRMIGECGKTYTCCVEYGGQTLTATTTIPAPVKIDSIITRPRGNGEKLHVELYFTDDITTQDYYCVFYRLPHTKQFLPCFTSPFTDEIRQSDGTIKVELMQMPTLLAGMDENLYFAQGDTITFRLARMDKQSYDFWKSFAATSTNSMVYVNNMTSLKSTVQGGIGYWCGYATDKKTIHL